MKCFVVFYLVLDVSILMLAKIVVFKCYFVEVLVCDVVWVVYLFVGGMLCCVVLISELCVFVCEVVVLLVWLFEVGYVVIGDLVEVIVYVLFDLVDCLDEFLVNWME